MIWKEIRKSNEIFNYVPLIWRTEQNMPRWWKDASKVWQSTIDGFRSFVEECDEVYGLFDGEKLMMCVYFEATGEDRMIHLSVLNKIKPSDFIEKCSELRNTMFRSGVKHIRGWIVAKNFGLCRLLAGIGFTETGLLMDKGESHGRTLRWMMVEVYRG